MKKFIRLILSAVVIFSNFSMHVKAEAKKPEVSAKACVLIEEKTGRIVYEKKFVSKASDGKHNQDHDYASLP